MTRVAYVCADPGIPVFGTKGASVHVQEIIRAWLARGAEVTLYCTRLGHDRPDDLADVRVVHVPVTAGDAAAREQAARAAARTLADAVIADGADLVYERYALFSDALAVATKALGVPGVLEVNAPLIDEQRTHRVLVDAGLAERTLGAQLATASRIACVSEPVADWVRAMGAAPDRVVVTPNGVNVDRLRPVTPAAGDPVVVFVGTLKPWHGVEGLLDAAAVAAAPWRVRIIGDGPQAEALQARAAELRVPVEFTGAVAPADMPAALAGASVGVAPYPASADESYFSPLKVYEYCAAGLAVVASAVGQLPDIVDDGDTGLLVPPSDAAALAGALDRLAADPALTARLGAAGRRRMEAGHTWHHVLDATLGGLR